MKSVLTAAAAIIGLCVLLLAGAVGYLWVSYYSEYNALLKEIQKHPTLQIVDHWRHEDMTLEDFGFGVQSARAGAFVNIVDGSNIRRPSDRAVGIAFHLRGEILREGNATRVVHRFIEFDSADWQQRGLPKIGTVAEFLAHFDAITQSLLNTPPVTSTAGPLPDFINIAPITGPQRSKSPPVPLSKL